MRRGDLLGADRLTARQRHRHGRRSSGRRDRGSLEQQESRRRRGRRTRHQAQLRPGAHRPPAPGTRPGHRDDGRSQGGEGGPQRGADRSGRRAVDAAERSRTSTSRRTQAPEACASTSSATAAGLAKLSLRTSLGWLHSRPQKNSPLSSRGLGRRILSPETRVRIPVAVPHESRLLSGIRHVRGPCSPVCSPVPHPAHSLWGKRRPLAALGRVPLSVWLGPCGPSRNGATNPRAPCYGLQTAD